MDANSFKMKFNAHLLLLRTLLFVILDLSWKGPNVLNKFLMLAWKPLLWPQQLKLHKFRDFWDLRFCWELREAICGWVSILMKSRDLFVFWQIQISRFTNIYFSDWIYLHLILMLKKQQHKSYSDTLENWPKLLRNPTSLITGFSQPRWVSLLFKIHFLSFRFLLECL